MRWDKARAILGAAVRPLTYTFYGDVACVGKPRPALVVSAAVTKRRHVSLMRDVGGLQDTQ